MNVLSIIKTNNVIEYAEKKWKGTDSISKRKGRELRTEFRKNNYRKYQSVLCEALCVYFMIGIAGCETTSDELNSKVRQLPVLQPFDMASLLHKSHGGMRHRKDGLNNHEMKAAAKSLNLEEYLFRAPISFKDAKQKRRYANDNDWNQCLFANQNVAMEIMECVRKRGFICIIVDSQVSKRMDRELVPTHSYIMVVEASSILLYNPHPNEFFWPPATYPLINQLTKQYLDYVGVVNGAQKTGSDCCYRCLDFVEQYSRLPSNAGLPRLQHQMFQFILHNGNLPLSTKKARRALYSKRYDPGKAIKVAALDSGHCLRDSEDSEEEMYVLLSDFE